MKKSIVMIISLMILLPAGMKAQEKGLQTIVAYNEEVIRIQNGFKFTEGPAVHPDGRVFFTDQPNNKIHIWDESDQITVFEVDGERSNGLYFSKDGQLIACADYRNKLIKIDMQGNKTVLADEFDGKHLNGPNDVWEHPKGNIYFTDSYYKRPWWPEGHEQVQDERAVYLLTKKGKLSRVAQDFEMPNGIIGTPDGKYLYVADINARKTWRYDILGNGKLNNKTLFAEYGSDGMTIDNQGNVYFTTGSVVLVIDKNGNKVGEIQVPENPANVCFGGKNRDVLFITARTSVYRIKMKVRGVGD